MNIDIKNTLSFISRKDIDTFQDKITIAHKALIDKTGKGNDYLGWVKLPSEIDNNIIDSIETIASEIRKKVDILVVIGIGGSYLGARAIIDALNHHFASLKEDNKNPLVIYAGQNISEDYLVDLLEILDQKEYAISVISKSGTTTEPAIAFRVLRNHIENKYGIEEARNRIIAITDKSKGALKQLATEEGYKTFIVPDDVGGRYSVLTPVGLLPIAVAGFDIRKLIQGAVEMRKLNEQGTNINDNPMALYAAVRNALYQKGKKIEILVNYEPNLFYLSEWWKQLYGESEGKEGKGIFPAGVNFTTDLHSMGQYIQDGQRSLFETVLTIEKSHKKISIPKDESNLDGLNYLAGRRFTEVNKMAELGTTLAHIEGGVPNINISIPEVNEYYLGQLVYFFEMSCGLSGYLLDVNPFDQPGVEAYKKNMFALLGKPGFEEETEKLKKYL